MPNLHKPMLQRWIFYHNHRQFCIACGDEATRHCSGNLAEATGELPRLIADAYLMGGEL